MVLLGFALLVMPIVLEAALLSLAPGQLARLAVFRAGKKRVVRLRPRLRMAAGDAAAGYRENATVEFHEAPAFAEVTQKLEVGAGPQGTLSMSQTGRASGSVALSRSERRGNRRGRVVVRVDVIDKGDQVEIVPRHFPVGLLSLLSLLGLIAYLVLFRGVSAIPSLTFALLFAPALILGRLFAGRSGSTLWGEAVASAIEERVETLDKAAAEASSAAGSEGEEPRARVEAEAEDDVPESAANARARDA